MARRFGLVAALLASLTAAACGGVELKPGDTARNNRDFRQGSGFLTGSSGEFTIFRLDADPSPAAEDAVAPDEAEPASMEDTPGPE